MSKRSILVVDDDKNTRDYLAAFLGASGYSVECLESGDAAIHRLASGYFPSMILLDVMLPGKDGIEVMANIKAIYPTLPIIILSGIGQIKTVVEAMKMGASDYLTKPFEEEALELAITSLPTPDSPRIRTGTSVAATCREMSMIRSICGFEVRMFPCST